jgi:acetyl-CoA C-acetyltransferase
VGSNIQKRKTALAINMVCGSGLRSLMLAAQSIKSGDAGLMLPAELSMSHHLTFKKARTGYRAMPKWLIL